MPAAIYAAWEKALKECVWELMVPREARSVLPAGSLSTEKIIAWLTAPDGRFGADPIAGRDALVLKALDQAVAGLEQRLGPDMNRWQYGQAKLKHVLLKHPLSDAVGEDLRARLDLEPAASGRVRPHRQQHLGRRQPGDRRLVPDHRRRGRLGPLRGDQHPRAVGRPGQPPLPRPVRALGRRAGISRRSSRAPRSNP